MFTFYNIRKPTVSASSRPSMSNGFFFFFFFFFNPEKSSRSMISVMTATKNRWRFPLSMYCRFIWNPQEEIKGKDWPNDLTWQNYCIIISKSMKSNSFSYDWFACCPKLLRTLCCSLGQLKVIIKVLSIENKKGSCDSENDTM